jgi:hypothetical protein
MINLVEKLALITGHGYWPSPNYQLPGLSFPRFNEQGSYILVRILFLYYTGLEINIVKDCLFHDILQPC